MIKMRADSCLSFAVQTLPDIAALRRLYALPHDLSDFEVAEYAFQRQRVKTGHADLPAHLCQIRQIVLLAYAAEGGFTLQSFAAPALSESLILQKASQALGCFKGQVSYWDEGGLLPLLRCRVHAQVLGPQAGQEPLLPRQDWLDLAQACGVAGINLREFSIAMPGLLPDSFVLAPNDDPWRLWLARKYDTDLILGVQVAVLSHYALLRHQLVMGCIDTEQYQTRGQQLARLI
ncbi:hypothetical protein [Uliginosibacterium gangwonense]|uniref:hypothetical protein n=1 Tax=Uliginosibacterium gangwonense TaxID=392736 RepID=UPI00037FC8F9|nr:hypothetical protein [Uliginosibacterium gangwonense]